MMSRFTCVLFLSFFLIVFFYFRLIDLVEIVFCTILSNVWDDQSF